jgi:polyphenol oxidase
MCSAFGCVRWVVSERPDGDFCPDSVAPELLLQRQRGLVDLPWTLIDQAHGIDTAEVTIPGQVHCAQADIVATSVADAVVGIWAGDCLPLLLISPEGRIVMAHVGWRGLVAGVVQRAMGLLGPAVAVIGPHIGPCCYQFSGADIAVVASSIGVSPERISAPSSQYGVVLDMGAAVRHVLEQGGISDHRYAPGPHPVCTGCDPRWFSHRVRNEAERHVMAAWRMR